MSFSELRNRVEFRRWCREHPQQDWYQDRTGCGMPVVGMMIVVGLMGLVGLLGCRTKYVPVLEVHEQHHWHTDSIRQTDSIYHEKETVVMQLDSTAMARYGIQLASNERAWLVRTAELERQLQQLNRLMTDRDSVHDSIPVPVPVEVVKEIAKPLTWWQKIFLGLGVAVLTLSVILCVVWVAWKILVQKLKPPNL